MKKTLLIALFASGLLLSQTKDVSFGGSGTTFVNTPSTRDIAFNFFTNPDHSMVVLGSPGMGSGGMGFTTFRMIYKTAENGTMDTSFGTAGASPTSIMVNQDHILRLSDGKFITMGRHFGLNIQKFNADGTFDTAFGNNGTMEGIDMNNASGYYIPNGVIELANGQLIVAGAGTDTDNKLRTVLLRINTNGTLDTSFGINGKKFIYLNTNDTGSVAHNIFLSNNKLILTGADGIAVTPPTRTFYVARLNLDGAFDTAFGNNGRIMKTFTNDNTSYVDAARDDSGNIYIGGWCKATPASTTTSTRIMKVTPEGALDSAFGDNGVATYSFLNINGYKDEMIKSIAIGSNGIYVGGYMFETSFYYEQYASGFLSKFNLDGTPDLSFGNNGFYNFFGADQMMRRVAKIKFDDKKRLIVAGDSKLVDRQFTLTRFNIGNETLGIQGNSIITDEIKLYPNPANDFIRLKNLKSETENIDFKITDLSGKLIKTGHYKQSETIDVHDLEPGIYFIRMILKNGKVHTEKIIKR